MRSLSLALLLATSLAGCPPRGAVCSTDASCTEFDACLRGHCTPVECRSNTHCPLETICNPDTYTCDPGCISSEDCLVGDRCDVVAGVCIARVCTNTQLDCDFGERCDLQTGTCYEDPEPHCARCVDDDGCGENGACGRVTSSGSARCFLECTPESFDPCPSGMQCTRTSEELFRCVGFCGGL